MSRTTTLSLLCCTVIAVGCIPGTQQAFVSPLTSHCNTIGSAASKLGKAQVPLCRRQSCSGVAALRAHDDGGYSKEEGFNTAGPRKAGGSTGDLAILGALRTLRSGDLQQTREVWFPGTTNEAFKFMCQNANFFVKINRQLKAADMFEGEAASLNAMRFAGMRCPAPLRFGDLPDGGSYLITEFVDLDPFSLTQPLLQESLGQEIAKMHMHQPERHQFFGFGVPTLLGNQRADNGFLSDWSTFFVERRLVPVLDQALKRYPYKTHLLSKYRAEIIKLTFQALEEVKEMRPSILHGDLQFSNAGVVESPYGRYDIVVFDPCSFYGHSEFDLAFEGWPLNDLHSEGLSDDFLKGYHSVMPRRKGHDRRKSIYQLFHVLRLIAKTGPEHLPLAAEMAKCVIRGTGSLTGKHFKLRADIPVGADALNRGFFLLSSRAGTPDSEEE